MSEGASSNLQHAVQMQLGGTRPASWKLGRAQLREEAMRRAAHDDEGDGAEALRRAIGGVLGALQQSGSLNDNDTVRATGEVLYAAARTAVNLRSATEVWDQQQFHAVRMKMTVQSMGGGTAGGRCHWRHRSRGVSIPTKGAATGSTG